MGITYSSEPDNSKNEDEENQVTFEMRQQLRLSYDDVSRFVEIYSDHCYQPIIDLGGLRSLFNVAIGNKEKLNITELIDTLWLIFEDDGNGICFIQEVLVTLILLSDGSWNKRLGLVFNLFKCLGVNSMMHEDIQLASQVVAAALCKLWAAPLFEFDNLSLLSEEIADNAYTKVMIYISCLNLFLY
jgi:hypothetical protein